MSASPSRKRVRQYLSSGFDPIDAAAVTAAYEDLERRDVDTTAALEKWILDWEELGAAIHDRASRAHVASTVDTTDEAGERAYLHIVENILPLNERFGFKLNRKLLASPACTKLGPYHACYLRAARREVEIFREENVALKTEEQKLVTDFEKIMGGMSAVFRGQELTMQHLARFLEEPDRATRREAYEARAGVRRARADELDSLYDRMLEVRRKIASNAGFTSFRDYQFAAMHRFDYNADDCFRFHEAIEKHIVPAVSRLHGERRKKLGVPRLAPYDLSVDPVAKEPVRPFTRVDELVDGCRTIFSKVDAELGALFDVMRDGRLLDLDSRKGKAPGGYCTHFDEERVPFIFMNAAGTKRDVETLLHEGGHSFHYFLAGAQTLATYHSTGLEFAEVASMSMELLARPYLGEFYSGDALERVRSDQLKHILEFFPFMAMIDAFQHWVYTAPPSEATAAGRKRFWASLEKRFQPELDWTQFEDVRDLGWQYPHVFAVPFYYVEYGIAQMGALSVWAQSLVNHRQAVDRYKEGLRLGGSKPLPELFAAVGARFGMTGELVEPLVRAVERELLKA